MKLSRKPEMNPQEQVAYQMAEDFVDETADLLDSLSNRTIDTAESIAELADEMEQLSSEIKSLLDDLRILQSRVAQPIKDRLDPLIDRLESIYRGLETAVWTMDCAREGLSEDTDLLGILGESFPAIETNRRPVVSNENTETAVFSDKTGNITSSSSPPKRLH